MFLLETASHLSNGAKIIARELNSRVVLCEWKGVQPWVVWRLDNEGNANDGDYFANLVDAQERYESRIPPMESRHQLKPVTVRLKQKERFFGLKTDGSHEPGVYIDVPADSGPLVAADIGRGKYLVQVSTPTGPMFARIDPSFVQLVQK